MSTVPGTRQGAVLPVRLVSTDRIECTLAVSSSASSRHISSACAVINENGRKKKIVNYPASRSISQCCVFWRTSMLPRQNTKWTI